MRAVLLRVHGGPEVLQPATVPDPEPGPGQVRVDLVRAALNHRDVWIREGRPGPLPAILGSDGAGVVSEVGAGVQSLTARRRGGDQPFARLGRGRGRAGAGLPHPRAAGPGHLRRANRRRRPSGATAPGRMVVGRVRRPSAGRPYGLAALRWPEPAPDGGSW